MQIADYLKRSRQKLVTCLPHDSLRHVAETMHAMTIGALPVCDENGRMLGIITERDLVRACATLEWSDDLQHVKASELMTRAVVSCGPQDTLQKAQDLMRTYNFRHVPVVEGERVIGILSIRDTLALRLQETEEEVNVLRDVVVAARHR